MWVVNFWQPAIRYNVGSFEWLNSFETICIIADSFRVSLVIDWGWGEVELFDIFIINRPSLE